MFSPFSHAKSKIKGAIEARKPIEKPLSDPFVGQPAMTVEIERKVDIFELARTIYSRSDSRRRLSRSSSIL